MCDLLDDELLHHQLGMRQPQHRAAFLAWVQQMQPPPPARPAPRPAAPAAASGAAAAAGPPAAAPSVAPAVD